MKMNRFGILLMAALMALVFVFVSPRSDAASVYNIKSASGLPTSLATSASSNINHTMTVVHAEQVAMVFDYLPGGTTTQNITITIEYSVDGTTYADAPTTSWVFAAPGATNQYQIGTNLPTYGWGYMRIKSIANAGSGSTITPVSLKYSEKILGGR